MVNSKFPQKTIMPFIHESLKPLRMFYLQGSRENCYQLGFYDLSVFKNFSKNYIVSCPFATKKDDESFVIQITIEKMPHNIIEEELIELIDTSCAKMKIPLNFFSDLGIIEIIFPNEEAFLIVIIYLLQTINENKKKNKFFY